MKKIKVTSVEETNALASKIASVLSTPTLIVMSGELGSGKTTFTKGLAKALGVKKTVTSPTFAILKSYRGNNITLHHIDAYRLEGVNQDLGFEEIFEEENVVCVIEWFSYIEKVLPKNRLLISIELEDDVRIFSIFASGEQYKEILEVL